MQEFPLMDFPKDKVTGLNLFRDEQLLRPIEDGRNGGILPKVAETYGPIAFPFGREYPYSFASIALSMDGKMAYPDNPDGDMLVHSNTLNPDGALADFYILNVLRAYSDAVLIGTASMIAEANVWITVHDEELNRQRREFMPDKPAQPYTIVATKDGKDIPFDHLLFHQDRVPLLLFTSPEGMRYLEQQKPGMFTEMGTFSREGLEAMAGKNPVVVTGSGNQTDPDAFFRILKKGGIDHLLIESPTMMWVLMKEELLNEFFITYSSIFVGGPMTPGSAAPFTFGHHPQSRMASVNRHGNTFLFVRQILEPAR